MTGTIYKSRFPTRFCKSSLHTFKKWPRLWSPRKRLRARLVLGSGTAWEYLRVLSAFCPQPLPRARKRIPSSISSQLTRSIKTRPRRSSADSLRRSSVKIGTIHPALKMYARCARMTRANREVYLFFAQLDPRAPLHVACGWLSQLKLVLHKGLVVQIARRW